MKNLKLIMIIKLKPTKNKKKIGKNRVNSLETLWEQLEVLLIILLNNNIFNNKKNMMIEYNVIFVEGNLIKMH